VCLYTKQDKPKTVRKRRTVYKVLDKDNRSPYQGFEYKRGVQLPIVVLDVMETGGAIRRGYHAYRTVEEARKSWNFLGDHCTHKLVEFYLPVGAKYYEGTDGDIVSDRIEQGFKRVSTKEKASV
jgi:hypothetical protein